MNCTGIKQALFWGYFVNHCQKAKLGNHKAFHVTMAVAEFFPLLSQFASMIEFLFWKAHQNKNSSKQTIKLSKSSHTTLTKSKTQNQADKSLTNSKYATKASNSTTSSSSDSITDSATSSSFKPTLVPTSGILKATQYQSQSSTKKSIKLPETLTDSKKQMKKSLSSNSTGYVTKHKVILGTKIPTNQTLKKTLHIAPDLYDGEPDLASRDLHKAIVEGNLAEVKKLLAKQSKEFINQRFGYSMLEWAVREGHFEMVKFLVKSGAKDALAKLSAVHDKRIVRPHNSALLVAALYGHIAIAKYLLDNGAKNKEFYHSDVLKTAVQTGNLKMVKLLVSYEQDPSDYTFYRAQRAAYESDQAVIYKFFLTQGVDSPLLYSAAQSNKPNFVKMLIKSGLSIDAKILTQGTPCCIMLHVIEMTN